MKAAARAGPREGPSKELLAGDPVDLCHLRRYTLGDTRLELEVLDLFVAQLPITIDALKAAATNRDWTVAAHTLKGSARAVGAWHLATLAERAEGLGGISDPVACGWIVQDLEAAAAQARAFVNSLGRGIQAH